MAEWIRLIDEIAQVLQQLIDLAKEKREVIVKGDVERLEALTRAETGLSAQLGNLETQRQRAVVVHCLRAGMDTTQITLAQLLPTLPDGEERRALEAAREDLIEKTHTLMQLGDINEELLTTQTEITQYMIEGASHYTAVGTQYAQNGQDAEQHDQIRLLSTDI